MKSLTRIRFALCVAGIWLLATSCAQSPTRLTRETVMDNAIVVEWPIAIKAENVKTIEIDGYAQSVAEIPVPAPKIGMTHEEFLESGGHVWTVPTPTPAP